MAIYRYGENSLIDEVSVHHTNGGGTRAYLHARDAMSPDALKVLKDMLNAHNLQTTPIQQDGKPMLEVRGIGKRPEHFLHLLKQSGATTGSPVMEATSDDKIGAWEKFRKNTLTTSGLMYMTGDIGFLGYGYKEAWELDKLTGKQKFTRPLALAAGAFYALGTPFLVFFGRGDKSDIQLRHMSYNLINDLEKQGVGVPPEAAARTTSNGHNSTLLKKLKSGSERYPAEITNSLYAGAGAMIMTEKLMDLKQINLKPLRNKMKDGWNATYQFLKEEQEVKHITVKSAHSPLSVIMDIGLGFMTVVAGLVSVFVEEVAPKPNEEKKTGVAHLAQKIREKPLAAASTALLVATSAHAASTYVDWKYVTKTLAKNSEDVKALKLKSALPLRGLFVVTNLAAEALMFFSSKGHGAGVKSDDSLERSAYAIGADLIHRAPPEKQEELMGKITKFYADKKHLAGDPVQIEAGIRAQLAKMDKNPWTESVPAKPLAENALPAQEETRWRGHAVATKTAAAAPAGHSL